MLTSKDRKRARKNGNSTSPLLTTGEVCRILSIHSNTLRRWSAQGIIKAYRVGPRGDRRFRREDVAALLIETTKDRQSRYK